MPPVETKAAHGGGAAAVAAAAAGAVLVVPLAVEVQAAAAPGAGAAAAAAAAQPAPAGPARHWTRSWTLVRAREPWAKAVLLLGCAAAALAAFAVALPTTGACVPTDAEAADLRAASMELLLAASAQVLAATVALRVPATPVNLAAWWLGSRTGFRATDVLGALASCHGRLDGTLGVYYCIVYAMFWVLLIVSFRRVQ